MAEPYVGQIAIFGFNFAPLNWVFCNGALMAISQNQAFFAIIGTTYGGNGITTFGVPNIGNSGVVNQGQGPGLSNYAIGETAGVTDVTLTSQQTPTHTHNANGTAGSAYGLTVANGSWMGQSDTGNALLFESAPAGGVNLAQATISIAGGSLPHSNEQPYLGMNYCIAQYGIFPSRN
jgi:microcystin-dependent protein